MLGLVAPATRSAAAAGARRGGWRAVRTAASWNAPHGALDGVEQGVVDMFEALREIRRDLHQHPELGLEETRTSRLVADELRRLGMEVRTGIGGPTGVVGLLQGTGEPPADRTDTVQRVGLRADMDCLPMQEDNSFGHKSKFDGRMHACGHDGHTTMLLGAARHLAATPESFAGSVMFVFQPAEENAGGARLMVEDGLMSGDLSCDEVYGVHNWPYLDAGLISVREGPIMASNDEFDLVVQGRGGHAAIPHLAVDPVTIACSLVSALQNVVARGVNPLNSAVLSVTQINGGSAYNVIPDRVTLKGTVRTFCEEDRKNIKQRLKEVSESVCAGFGASCKVKVRPGYPATVNADEQAAFARRAAELTVGPARVVSAEPTMGSEDFSYMLNVTPGCYAWIGCKSEGMLHQTNYDFDDDIIPVGVQFFCNVVRTRMPANGGEVEALAEPASAAL